MRANAFRRNTATRRAAWSPAYGGSANATSYCPGCSRSAKRSALWRCTTARSSTSSVLMFALRAESARRFNSTNSAVVAPRDNDSRPRAPEPANRSSTRAPGMERCRMLNHASRTRSAVGRVRSPTGVFRRRPLKSPAMMRTKPNPAPLPDCGFRISDCGLYERPFISNPQSTIRNPQLPSRTRRQRRHPRLQRRPPLPLVPLQPERHVERLRQPGIGHDVRPLKPDRRQRAGAVVEREAQVVGPDPPGADRAGAAHPEHRRRIPGPARLQVTHQLLERGTHQPERQLQIDALGGRQVVGAQKLARHLEKRNTERLVALPLDRQPRRHRVAAILLEVVPHPVQRGVQVEADDAAPRATAAVSTLVPPDQE